MAYRSFSSVSTAFKRYDELFRLLCVTIAKREAVLFLRNEPKNRRLSIVADGTHGLWNICSEGGKVFV